MLCGCGREYFGCNLEDQGGCNLGSTCSYEVAMNKILEQCIKVECVVLLMQARAPHGRQGRSSKAVVCMASAEPKKILMMGKYVWCIRIAYCKSSNW